MRRTVASAFFALITLCFFACAIYGPSLLGSVEAGADAPGPGDGGDGGPSCANATWPARPAKDDPATYDGGEIVLALQTIRFDPDAGGGNLLGYDLDRACTCPGKSSCNPSDGSIVCDDPNGRDNSGGVLLAGFSAFAGDVFDSAKLVQKIQDGIFTLLVRINNYNGAQNDTQITTAIFVSSGMKGIDDGGTPQKPKFDGTDDWTVDPTSLFGGTGPPFVPLPDSVDTMAYVSNGMLVAVVGEVKLTLSGTGNGGVTLDVSGAVITGHLTPNGKGAYAVNDGILAARWPARRMLTTLAGIKDPLGSGYLCGDSGTYQQIKRLICGVRDITAAVQNDNTGAFCDALSIGFGFSAAPARMGSPYAKPPPTPPCGAQWDDDCLK